MGGAVDAVDAAVPGAPGVVGVTDALDDQRQVGQRPQPTEVVPGQRVSEGRYPLQHGALRVLLGWALQAGAEDRVAGVVAQAKPPQLGKVGRGEVARAPSRNPGVQGDDDALVAGGFGPLNQAGGQVTVLRRVQLEEPGGVAELRGDVFHRIGGQGGNDHRDTGFRGRARGGQVAVAVLSADADDPDRCHEDRRRQGQAEQLHRQVAVGGTDEHARDQAPVIERLPVRPLRALVARAAGDVGPHRRRHGLLGPGLQFREDHRQRGRHPAQALEVDLVLVVAECHAIDNASRPSG